MIHVRELEHASPLPVAARIGRMVQSSAITGRGPDGEYPADVVVQAANAFSRLRLFLDRLGATPGDVLNVRIYLRSLEDRQYLDVAWQQLYPDPMDRPARHVVLSDISQFNPKLRMQLEVTVVLPSVRDRVLRLLGRLR